MKRRELEHVIRAAASIADDPEIIVIGSQAILGTFPDAPHSLLVSVDADVIPKNRPERAELIEGAIGEGSLFHDTFGYYANGVGYDTAVLPKGWERRLVPVRSGNTGGATGWCLDLHDLVLSKYAAGREKDLRFNEELVRTGRIGRRRLLALLRDLPLAEANRRRIRRLIDRAFGSTGRSG
ncbi:MAG: hypothetical protein M1550_04475 [Deltaproteobacteria bacterium]|nr:hypothetical protein [Deltaproteobacteria bacterium]